MRALLMIILISIWITSCKSSERTTVKNNEPKPESQKDTIRIENNDLEYEIIIIDSGFDSWMLTQKPMSFYSEDNLKSRNLFYVNEWNRRASMPSVYNPNLYNQIIYYDPSVDYGKEVNFRLFMYFEYFQQKYRQKL